MKIEKYIKKPLFFLLTWSYVVSTFLHVLYPNGWDSAWDVFVNIGGAAFTASCVYYGIPTLLNAMWEVGKKEERIKELQKP